MSKLEAVDPDTLREALTETTDPKAVRRLMIAITGSVGHIGDVGGRMGAWATDTRQVYEEGLLLPPVKFYEGGDRVDAVERIIRENIRIPDRVIGDIEALRSANLLGVDRVRDVLDEYDVETFDVVAKDILDRSARAFRNELEGIEDGTYEKRIPFSVREYDLEVSVAVTIDSSEIHVDFEGSSDEVDTGINCPFTSTRAATGHTLKALIIPEMKNSDGVWERVSITAAEGSIVNCTRPKPTDGRHLTYHPVQNAVIQALEAALPDRVLAGSAGANIINFNGVDSTGDEFVSVDANLGPFPAQATTDGINSLYFPSEVKNAPREVFEQYCPIRIEHRGLVPDSEGAGEHRSGLVTETVYANPTDSEVNVSITSDAANVPPAGLNGGHDGRTAVVTSETEDGELPTNGRFKMQPGDRIRIRTASGGGYGDPAERRSELIERDIELGYISQERARETYAYETE